MSKKEGLVYTKTEVEAENNNRDDDKWQELTGFKTEYWSEEAMKNRKLGGDDGKYPQQDGESDADYETRLQIIDEYASSDKDIETPPVENTVYTYDDDGALGYVFHKRARAPKEVNEIRLKTFFAQEILGSSDDARQNDKVLSIQALRKQRKLDSGNDSITKIAEYYVGPLSTSSKEVLPGMLQNTQKDDSRYSEKDLKYVKDKRAKIATSDAYEDEESILRIADKKLEGFIYPLFDKGFFDPGEGKTAGFFIASEYDDYANGVDTAIIVPLEFMNSDGKKEVLNQPISFDITAGDAKNKLDYINKNHGLTKIKYPSTIQKKELPPMENVPNFIICLPRKVEANQLISSLVKNELPSEELQFLINFQIWYQAVKCAEYWREHPNHLDDSKNFARISNFYREKTEKNLKKINGKTDDILRRHQFAIDYLSHI